MSIFILASCGGKGENKDSGNTENTVANEAKPANVDTKSDKGIGPVKNVVLNEQIDQEMADRGAKIFQEKCTACHKPNEKYIGPSPTGVVDRRSPEWIMNMILNPEVMIKENETAKQLLMENNGSPMANQNLTEEQARDVLEYFRTLK